MKSPPPQRRFSFGALGWNGGGEPIVGMSGLVGGDHLSLRLAVLAAPRCRRLLPEPAGHEVANSQRDDDHRNHEKDGEVQHEEVVLDHNPAVVRLVELLVVHEREVQEVVRLLVVPVVDGGVAPCKRCERHARGP